MLRITLAVIHLLALGIGLGAVWVRARALGERPLTVPGLRRAFSADKWWGIAALLWISTGVWRLMAGTEKPMRFYMENHLFFAKMGFLALILLLELYPMFTLLRWRRRVARAGADWQRDRSATMRIRAISYTQALLVIAMVVTATLMARGYGAR